MTLEFNRIVEQVYRMGTMLDKLDFDLTDRLTMASQLFQQADDLNDVWERIEWVRRSDISGYRGAAPLDLPNAEKINLIVPEPEAPQQATLIAADGSQVYPDEQAPIHYYLINIGLFTYFHGVEQTPQQATFPQLKYHKEYVHDRYGQIISNRTVDDRRTVEELRTLGDAAWQQRHNDHPVFAFYDNRLMYLPGNDAKDHDNLMKDYMGALVHLHDAGALLCGYIDNPFRSKRFIQLLYLLTLHSEADLKQHQHDIARAGQLDGLRDQQFFQAVLHPGERSAIMVQNSPQNKAFRDRGENYEIAFFYLKVYNGFTSRVIRVDLPVWVARKAQHVAGLHAMILHQCRMQGRNPYPYVLTRADELAWVSNKDRAKLEELVNVQVRRVREELIRNTLTAKTHAKDLARSGRRYFDIWGDVDLDERQ
jgi:hypothetical protein